MIIILIIIYQPSYDTLQLAYDDYKILVIDAVCQTL